MRAQGSKTSGEKKLRRVIHSNHTLPAGAYDVPPQEQELAYTNTLDMQQNPHRGTQTHVQANTQSDIHSRKHHSEAKSFHLRAGSPGCRLLEACSFDKHLLFMQTISLALHREHDNIIHADPAEFHVQRGPGAKR
ncbi:hypothetical protein INR49_021780 [Caranx melampygus]|nr:hypothetical protein INR49_021780 [Caranx melampygus]